MRFLFSVAVLSFGLLLTGCGSSTDPEVPQNSNSEAISRAEDAHDTTATTDEDNPLVKADPSQPPEISQDLRADLSKHSVFIEWSEGGWVINLDYAKDFDAAFAAAEQLSPWTAVRMDQAVIDESNTIQPSTALTDEHLERVGKKSALQSVSFGFNKNITDVGVSHLAGLTNLRDLNIGHSENVSAQGVVSLSPLVGLETLNVNKIPLNAAAVATIAEFKGLRSLRVEGCEITDDTIAPLAELVGLEELRLGHNQILGPGLKHLAGLRKLTTLDLGSNKRDDVKLDFAANGDYITGLSNLEEIDISFIDVGDTGLRHFSKMPALQFLDISAARVTGDGLQHLADARMLEKIEILDEAFDGVGLQHLAGCSKLTTLDLSKAGIGDEGMKDVAQLQQLTRLDLPPYGSQGGIYPGSFWRDPQSDYFTDASLTEIAKLKNLKRVWISGGGVTDKGMSKLAALEKLEHVGFGTLPNVKGDCLSDLAALSKIDNLDLEHTAITDENLVHLATFEKLTSVKLPSAATDAALKSLTNLKQLQFVYVGRKISQEAIAELKKAQPALIVDRY